MTSADTEGRVLVADDDPSMLWICERLLRDAGFTITRAPRGDVAMVLLRSQEFDVVVADVRMPGLSGLEVLDAVRAHDPALPVILMTGAAWDDGAREAVKSGAVQLLSKPFAPAVFQLAVRQAARLRQLAKRNPVVFRSDPR